MQKLARDYLDELNRRHKKNRKALVAWILLATLVVGTVMGTLSQYGVALSNDSGKGEHGHSSECYDAEGQLICGYEEHADTGGGQRSNVSFDEPAADNLDSDSVQTPSGDGSGDGQDSVITDDENQDSEKKDDESQEPATTDNENQNSTLPDGGTQEPVLTDQKNQNSTFVDTTEYISIEEAKEARENQGLAAMCLSVNGSMLLELGERDLDNGGLLNQPSHPWIFSTQYVGEKTNTTGGGRDDIDMMMSRMSSGGNELNQSSRFTTKTEDFNLKYQMNFENKTGVVIPAGAVKISILRSLLNKEDGSPVNPQDIAARDVTDQLENGEPPLDVQGVSFPFCYYIENRNGQDYLVFYNHKPIANDKSFLWQVLYKDVKLMDIEDGKEWNLQPTIEVNAVDAEGNPLKNSDDTVIASVGIIDGRHGQNIDPLPLGGRIDSSASITSVTETPYYAAGKSYAPGLYTRSQVESFIGGALPEWLEKKDADGNITETHFNDYKYVVWELNIKGKATQPWKLEVTDIPQVADGAGEQCKVVGYSRKDSNNIESGKLHSSVIAGNTVMEDGKVAADSLTTDFIRSESWSCSYWVVTAYPIADSTAEGTVLKNSVTVRVVPKWNYSADQPGDGGADQTDQTEQTAEASWIYQDYHWVYGNKGMSGVKKNDYSESPVTNNRYEKSYSGWLNAYLYAADQTDEKEQEDYGKLPFYVEATLPGYDRTHIVNKQGDTESKGTAGTYIPGTSYTLITTDDLLYAAREEDSSAVGWKPMNYRDYYYTGVTVTQTDTGYDVWEDREVMPADVPEDEYQALTAAGLINTPVTIYAMYGADENGTLYEANDSNAVKWTEVTDGSFDFRMNDQTGTMTYTFGPEILKRQPWRVKVVHETTHYKTACKIRTELCLRHNSPVMWGDGSDSEGLLSDAEMESGELTPVRLWGLAGAYGIVTTGRDDSAKKKNEVWNFSSAEAEGVSLPEVNKALYDLYWKEIADEYKCANA